VSSGPWLEERPVLQRNRSGGTHPGWQFLGQKPGQVRNTAVFAYFYNKYFCCARRINGQYFML